MTTYTYGTTKGTSAGDSTIATGHLLFKEQYPDSSDATNDVIKHAYNAQGQEIWRKDQLGCIVQTDYDTGGRVLHRRVTDLGSGSGLDGTVLRISTAYLSRGPIDTVTQYDNATVGSGTAKDQVQYTYDGWGNLTKFEQDVDSAIGASGRAAFSVQYAYTKATPTNGAPAVRRTSMTYPGSAQLNYVYDTGSLNDQASRVYQMAWNSASTTYLARYEYLGGGQVVRTTYPDLSGGVYSAAYDPAGTAHAYANLDRFGRVTHNQWTNGLSGGTSFYDTTITYDRLSNITSTDDATPNGTTPGEWADVLYGLDAVGRLTDADEGKLASGSIATRTRRELWKDGSTLKLSQTGNWLRRKLDTNGDGDYGDWQEVDDTGTFNKANEWLTRDLDSTSGTTGDNYTLTTDAAGNLTNDAKSYKYVYDAFGRMVEAKNQSNTTLTKYRYNGLGHRILWQYDANSSGTLTDSDRYYFCYDERWRIVATFRDQDSNPKERFVYHSAGRGGYGGSSYIDLCVLRDRDNNGGGGWTGAADSTLEERTYFCQNWRADVVAVASASSYGLYVKQRFKYDSYGSPRFHGIADYHPDGGADSSDNGDFMTDFENGNPRADLNFDGGVDINDQLLFLDAFYSGGPDADVRKLYAGYEWDRITRWGNGPGWYHVRHRVLLPELGRWSRRDPAGYADGVGWSAYVNDRPFVNVDPSGLCSKTFESKSSCSARATLDKAIGMKQQIVPGIPADPPSLVPLPGRSPGGRIVLPRTDPRCSEPCRHDIWASVYCDNGQEVICACALSRDSWDELSPVYQRIWVDCVLRFEDRNIDDGVVSPCRPGDTGYPNHPGPGERGYNEMYCRKARNYMQLYLCLQSSTCWDGQRDEAFGNCEMLRCRDEKIALCKEGVYRYGCDNPNFVNRPDLDAEITRRARECETAGDDCVDGVRWTW